MRLKTSIKRPSEGTIPWFSVRDTNHSTFEITKRPSDVQIGIHFKDGNSHFAYLTYGQYEMLLQSETHKSRTR